MWETICDAKAKFVLKFLTTLCSGIWFTTPLLPENWKLGRFWHFRIWVPEHLPPKKLKFRQILVLWDLTSRTLSPLQWQLEYVETNRCIPQGYHLVTHCWASAQNWSFTQIENTLSLEFKPLYLKFLLLLKRRERKWCGRIESSKWNKNRMPIGTWKESVNFISIFYIQATFAFHGRPVTQL